MPGDPSDKDGLVFSIAALGGRTAVHEIGHWLSLRHLWGDADCGDDGVADTPKQTTYTNGCPSGVRISCNNAPYGDMYMDYMDFTDDACIVMFTKGQKQKMRALFEPGGAALFHSFVKCIGNSGERRKYLCQILLRTGSM